MKLYDWKSAFARYRQVILYLFFGGLAFLVNIALFALFHLTLNLNELVANALSWVITVLFAFFTNRIWVFAVPSHSAKEFLVQLGAFFGGRMMTLAIEEAILFVFITKPQYGNMLIKVVAQIVVIVLNYVISKLIIFKKKP